MTFSDLLKTGITHFIDNEFVLKAKVMWKYADVKIPESPVTDADLQKQAGKLAVAIEGPEFKDLKRSRASMQAGGVDIVKTTDPVGREGYAFKMTPLSNGEKIHVLTVRLKLRAAFNKSMLENPAFVSQCDNPVYWSQTFELEILDVKE